MRSIQTKITLLTVCAIVLSLAVAAILASIAINDLGNSDSNRILLLLCETGEKNLDRCFESVERSVETISGYAEADLKETELSQLASHLRRVQEFFGQMADHTEGILTYYYRIDPEVSTEAKGFWYVNLGGGGFREHEVTDITLYDTDDQSALVWFTVPRATGRPVWLPPYVTENLDAYVFSYNVPIYKDGRFIGVIGIEIDYKTIVEPVNSITLYQNGYAFINDAEGNIVYHPRMHYGLLTGEDAPRAPEGLLSSKTFIRYTYEGVEKQAVWLPLNNGMRLNVTVPIAEISSYWHQLGTQIIFVSLVLLLLFVGLALRFSGRIAGPLRRLTAAAEAVDSGNYDVELEEAGEDEVGILSRTFNRLVRNLKRHISDLNSLAYSDALTAVHNKGAFDIYIHEMEGRLQRGEAMEFAVGIFDCDNLKRINDRYGHDKGDIYIKSASGLICGVFQHSPVFRTGGDEFSMILQNEDFRNREELMRRFAERGDAICARAAEQWEEVRISLGVAVYDPQNDISVSDVIRRADKRMYENKRSRKALRGAEERTQAPA